MDNNSSIAVRGEVSFEGRQEDLLNGSAILSSTDMPTSTPLHPKTAVQVQPRLESSPTQKEKKTTFQITRVVSRGHEDTNDSLEDRNGVEDFGSDVSQATDVVTNVESEDATFSPTDDDVDAFEMTTTTTRENEMKERDVHSRFRLVKIDNKDTVRHGRWFCVDLIDGVLKKNADEASQQRSLKNNNGTERKESQMTDVEMPAAIDVCDQANNILLIRIPSSSDDPSDIYLPTSISTADRLNPSSRFVQNSTPLSSTVLVAPRDFFNPPLNPSKLLRPSESSTSSKNPTESDVTGAVGSGNSSRAGSVDFMSKFETLQSVTQNLLASRKRLLEGETGDDEESGASAVAIDNKIEQAMDLVKSHLMFAVREEVELLKIRIQELTERNGRLEYENKLLRASVPDETLAKLHHLHQHQHQQQLTQQQKPPPS